MQLGVACLAASLLLLCFAQWHVRLLFLALVLAGGFGFGLLPVLRLLATQVAPAQQAAATATVLAVGHGAKAIGLAVHAYVFAEAAAHGLLYAPFALGAVASLVALVLAVACPPPEEAWRSSPHAHSRTDRQLGSPSSPGARARDD